MGVGQDEVDVVKTADVVMVVCVPGMGDNIQAIKAGIMEIADIFVVNKADREGSERAVLDIRLVLNMNMEKGLQIPIVKTVATKGEGIPELAANLFEVLESQERENLPGRKNGYGKNSRACWIKKWHTVCV